MKLHPRFFVVKEAKAKFDDACMNLLNDLTYVEALQVLNEAQAAMLKYCLRKERHPDEPEKKGDEA